MSSKTIKIFSFLYRLQSLTLLYTSSIVFEYSINAFGLVSSKNTPASSRFLINNQYFGSFKSLAYK